MDVIRGVDGIPPSYDRTVLTIGNYDGVHLAHRHICGFIKKASSERGVRSTVLTFDPHPLSVVAPDRCPPLMTTIDEKLARLEEQGIDATIVQPFTPELAAMTAEEFIFVVVHEKVKAGMVCVGFNFRFGKDRKGNIDLLRREGRRLGFETCVIEPFYFRGSRVSSSEIRKLLLAGDVGEAASLLGNFHLIEGPVVKGEGRGSQIGIPTANIDYPSILVPANGVYACWVQIGGRNAPRHPAVTNIGHRPTFDGGKITVEAHLLEGGRDLYGEVLRVEFVSRLREERKFSGPQALVAQIRRDIEEGRTLLRD